MNQIKIDPERISSDIDRNIFGWHVENEIYGGIYCPDSPLADREGLRIDVRTVLDRLKHSIIRYPGGNFASGYRWMDGIGPKEYRPARHDLAWRCITSNHFGTNEFITFCRKINAEPYLTVNCGDGDMREAADWVEYCNGTGDTALVKLREKHGFEAPHRVKYWSVGNEVDNLNQIGYKTPDEYARAYTEFSKVMKRVDPEIKLIASGVCNWEDNPSHMKTEWVERAQLILEQAGDRIDYISFHRLTNPYEDDPFETAMAFATDFNERLSAYEGLIRAVSLERGIKHAIHIAVDEYFVGRMASVFRSQLPINISRDKWGVMRFPEGGGDNRRREGRRIITLEDALVVSLQLNAFIRHAHSVRMANTSPLMSVLAANNLESLDSMVILPTIFYPFELYCHSCGPVALDIFWSGETFTGTFKNRIYTGIRTLDVAATLDEFHKQLVVYVINQSKEQAMETTISLTRGEFTGSVNVSVVNGPDIKAENTKNKPTQVSVTNSVVDTSGKALRFTFEPHSITVMVCTIS